MREAGLLEHLGEEVRPVDRLAHRGGGGDVHDRGLGPLPARRAKRRRACKAMVTPSGDSRPVRGRSRPSPASTFSLKTVQRARPSMR